MQKERINFHWYGTPETMAGAASNMIAFGAENLKRASVIMQLDKLKEILEKRETGEEHLTTFHDFMHQFAFEKYTDLVKICLFFENYMKAQLICHGYLIHKIKRGKGCDTFAGQQTTQPVHTKELHDVVPFDVDVLAATIYHEALSDQTLSIIGSQNNHPRLWGQHTRQHPPVLVPSSHFS